MKKIIRLILVLFKGYGSIILFIVWWAIAVIFLSLSRYYKVESPEFFTLKLIYWVSHLISSYYFVIGFVSPYKLKRIKVFWRIRYRNLIKKTKEFDLTVFLTTFPELEFIERTISILVKKCSPRFHTWGSNKLESLCECKEGEMFSSFTGMILVVTMVYWSARTMVILFLPVLTLLSFFYFCT